MKNQKMKKAMSLALAGVMAMSLSATAFAARGDTTTTTPTTPDDTTDPSTPTTPDTPVDPAATEVQKSLDFEAVLQAPTIEVEMTANNAIIMNPYMLTYVDPVSEEEESESLATAVNIITSKTLAPLDVDVTVTGTAPSGVAFADDSVADSTDKEIFLQFALQGASDDDVTSPSWDTSSNNWSAQTTWNTKLAVNSDGNKAELITLDGTEQTYGVDDVYYVMAAAEDADTPVYAAFKLIGDCSAQSETPWTAADKVDVAVAFTFNIMSNGQLS